MTTCQLFARGLTYKAGSLEDTFARSAIETERRVELAKTMVIVNAIIGVGNHIASAVAGGSSSKKNLDSLNNSLGILKQLLVPEEATNLENEAEKAKALLKREAESGPISFVPIGTVKSKKGTVKMR